jgi:hypothetical protein
MVAPRAISYRQSYATRPTFREDQDCIWATAAGPITSIAPARHDLFQVPRPNLTLPMRRRWEASRVAELVSPECALVPI